MAQTREHRDPAADRKADADRGADQNGPRGGRRVAEVQAEVEQTPGELGLTPSLSFPPRRRKTSVLRNCAAICCSLRSAPARSSSGFASALDRAYRQRRGAGGHGTALSGEVRVGDTLWLTGVNTPMRVRGLHAQNQAVEQAHRRAAHCAEYCRRCAKEAVHRGDWLSHHRRSQQNG